METRTGVEGYRPFPKLQGERGFLTQLKARLVLPTELPLQREAGGTGKQGGEKGHGMCTGKICVK